jgi:hypothetical protein
MFKSDMQKHPSSLAVLEEIFVVIGGNFSKGSRCFARISVERGENYSLRD